MMGLTRESKWQVCEVMEVRFPWIDSDDEEEETANETLLSGQVETSGIDSEMLQTMNTAEPTNLVGQNPE